MARNSIVAVVGAAIGWFASLTFKDTAQVVAGFSTGAWMLAQAYVLLRRQKCTALACPHRQT